MASTMKYARLELGTIEAVFNKLGGVEGAQRFLRDEITLTEAVRSWREENGIIYFSVTSDGTTGKDWIERLQAKGFRVSDYAKSVLRSGDFQPTTGVTYEIAVLKGELFSDDERVTKKIRAFASKRKLTAPNAEVACLIREKFTDKQIEAMGLVWIVAMHEPIKNSGGRPGLLLVDRDDFGSWLNADWGHPDYGWDRDDGFACCVSQVSA